MFPIIFRLEGLDVYGKKHKGIDRMRHWQLDTKNYGRLTTHRRAVDSRSG